MNFINRFTTPVYLVALLAIGAFVRFFDIAKASIWHDEGYTMMLAPDGIGEILMRTGRDVHPPLYYIALHFWMDLFGNSETAARGLSAVFMLAVIPLTYLLIRRLYTEQAARVAALFVAIAPFLVRYSQEARMYGMVAFLVLLSTYLMVRAFQDGKRIWYALYAFSIAASLYTHYYAIFMIVVHWIYAASLTNRKKRTGLFNPWWWGANIGAALLFVPWLPTAIGQFTRVQGSFWIPPVNAATLPNTLLQFLLFRSYDQIPVGPKLILALVFAGLIAALWLVVRKFRTSTLLMAAYALVGPMLVVILSLKRPIYVDRYFVFAAVAFYALLGVIYALGPPFAKRRSLQTGAIVVTCAIFAAGIVSVYQQATHQMRKVGEVINTQIKPGDAILSGELYTFFDFSYYNHTGVQTQLWSKNGVNGYGESSLIYDRADQIVVRHLEDVHPASGYVWVVGKTGKKDYYDKVPANWTLAGPKYEFSSSAVRRYHVAP